MSKKLYKILILLIIACIIILWFIFDLEQFLTLEAIKQQYNKWLSFVNEHYAISLLGFFCLYIMLTSVSIPWAVFLAILAAALFGFWPATLLSSFATAIGATFAFLISRYLLRDFIEDKFAKTSAKVNQQIDKNGSLYLLSLRIVPVLSFTLINIIMALTSMRIRDFYIMTQAGMLPTILIYTYLGQELSHITSFKDLMSVPILASLLLLAVVPWILKGIMTIINRQKSYNI